MALNGRISRLLLDHYYRSVCTLEDFVAHVTEDTPHIPPLYASNDPPCYGALLRTSFVCSSQSPKDHVRLKRFTSFLVMRDLIDRAQEILFSQSRWPSNVVTQGYRSTGRYNEQGRTGNKRMGISNYFTNTIVTGLQAPEWQTLLQRVGDTVMLHLLANTSIFVALPNGCLCQVTGEPIVHLKSHLPGIPICMHSKLPVVAGNTVRNDSIKAIKRKADGPAELARPSKRRKLSTPVISRQNSLQDNLIRTSPLKPATPANVSFLRTRLYYARPKKVPRTDLIAVGFPPEHILNVISPSYHKPLPPPPGQYVDPDPRKQMDDARRLLKYIFPRQYKLRSAFEEHSGPTPDFTDREAEIKNLGCVKTPPRLKTVLKTIEKLIWGHHKCAYLPLRDKLCPSKLKSRMSDPSDESMILEMMSEHSILHTQHYPPAGSSISFEDSVVSIAVRSQHLQTDVRPNLSVKPKFLEFTCSHHEVFRYVVVVTDAIVPKQLWGSDHNHQLIMYALKRFIGARRYETFSVHSILQGVKVNDCAWTASSTSHGGPCDAHTRRELLEDFVYWYFDSFVLPLLKTTFYVTDSSVLRNHTLYFRQDDWRALCKPLLDNLTNTIFKKMEKDEVQTSMKQRKLGYSFVRLLPKETGVRPIVNLRRRAQKGSSGLGGQSINSVLQAAFRILTYEKEQRPELTGAAVFSHSHVHASLLDFKARLTAGHTDAKLPKLYFVKVDVQACFDTIEQHKLLDIIHELLSEDTYMVRRHGFVSASNGKITRKYAKAAHADGEHTHFLQYAAQLATLLRNTIMVDQVVYQFSSREEILGLIEEHVTENLVKIGNCFYRQMVGIPQGSILSTLLCSFFYGDLERKWGFLRNEHSLLLRQVDDYLLITADLPLAQRFLAVMNEGHPEYGCFISREKTLTNFHHDTQVLNVTTPHQREFPWCGYLFNMQDLSVSWDYSRFRVSTVSNTLTVETGCKPGAVFTSRMLRIASLRSHQIFVDPALNSKDIMYRNVYENFLATAFRMQKYLDIWSSAVNSSVSPARRRQGQNPTFVFAVIEQTISFVFGKLRSRLGQGLQVGEGSRNAPGERYVRREEITWLGMHAFQTAFSLKAARWETLLSLLRKRLPKRSKGKFHIRFGGVVKRGLQNVLKR